MEPTNKLCPEMRRTLDDVIMALRHTKVSLIIHISNTHSVKPGDIGSDNGLAPERRRAIF